MSNSPSSSRASWDTSIFGPINGTFDTTATTRSNSNPLWPSVSLSGPGRSWRCSPLPNNGRSSPPIKNATHFDVGVCPQLHSLRSRSAVCPWPTARVDRCVVRCGTSPRPLTRPLNPLYAPCTNYPRQQLQHPQASPLQRLVGRSLPDATGSLSAESNLREEGCDVTRKALRLLCGSKVPAAWHGGPPPNVVEPLRPFPRRASL
jgi:hypothetical protein